MTRVLAAADLAAARQEATAALAAADTEVEHVRKRVEVAIQRQARFVYFQGTLLGTAAAVVLCVAPGLVSAHHRARRVRSDRLRGRVQRTVRHGHGRAGRSRSGRYSRRGAAASGTMNP
jgi:hypothetical protein